LAQSASASPAASAGGMIPHTDECLAGQKLAEGDPSNAEVDLKVTRGVQKQMLVRACATLTATCLVIGLALMTFESDPSHEAARVLSARTNQSEIGSNPQFENKLLGSTQWTYATVNAICVCNKLDQRPVRLLIGGKSIHQGNPWVNIETTWVSIRDPCTCIPEATLRKYFSNDRRLQCSYVVQNFVSFAIPCKGGGFIYSSTSIFSGQYDCGGSPPTCSKQAYCQGSTCWPAR